MLLKNETVNLKNRKKLSDGWGQSVTKGKVNEFGLAPKWNPDDDRISENWQEDSGPMCS